MTESCLVFLLAATLPATLTVFGLLYGRWEVGRPADPMPRPAGPWIEEQIRVGRSGFTVELVPARMPDAYLPATATLALSEATYSGTSPRDWAVAAHELGHADLARRPPLGALLPAARLVSALAWRLVIGALAIGLWLGEPVLATLGYWALALSLATGAVVCAEEVAASGFAWRLLRADPTVTRAARGRARDAMVAAAGAYALGWLGRLVILLAWEPIRAIVFSDPDLGARTYGHLGTWLVLVTFPVVLIRAGLAVAQVVRPERIPSELDLWALLQRDSLWESLAAACVVASLLAVHASLEGPALGVAAAVAAAAALGQIQAVIVAALMIPAVVAERFLVRRAPVRYRWRARDDIPQAMVAMFSDPPWYLRAMWLLPLGYVPLALLLFARIW
jgi:Zn-dependent membrane protease YugP